MSDSNSGFQNFLQAAVRRVRVQRLVNWTGGSLWVVAGCLFLAGVLVLLFPHAGKGIVIGLGATILGWMAVLLGVWFWPVDESRAARQADRQFGLPDDTLTAQELCSAQGEGWLRLQHEDAQVRRGALDWAAWPVQWPRWSALAGLAVIVLAAGLAVRLTLHAPEPPPVAAAGLTDEAAAIEEMLQDWEKAAEWTADQDLKDLLAELQPLREQLPAMNEREMFLALSKMETRLEALRNAADRESLEALAADLAAAFEPVEGQGALAAALRRKDFGKAAREAEKEAEKLARDGARIPEGANQPAAGEATKQAARKLDESRHSAAASALREIRRGAEKNDPSAMCQGMGKLGQCLAREASRQAARQRLGLQLAQVGQCKGGLGRKESLAACLSLMPKLSQSMASGQGAGSATDPNRLGDPTALASERLEESLAGVLSEGDSETETLSSDVPGGEAPRADRAAQFAHYEKLSRQAIADEDLPPAHRETIRKYFEAIKPPPPAVE